MISVASVSFITGYIFILYISLHTIIHILKNTEDYGTKLISYLNAAAVLIGGIIYSSLFLFSVVFYFSDSINLLFWKFSIFSYIIFLIIYSIIYAFFKDYEKFRPLPNIFFALLFGFLIGDLHREDSILFISMSSTPLEFVITDISLINFRFDFYTEILVALILLSIIIYLLYKSLTIAFSVSDINECYPLFLNTLITIIPIMMFLLYVFLENSLYCQLFITLFWIANISVDIMLIKNPEMFFILPNKIFGINIFHKSGILLYSYEIDRKKSQEIDSTTWGSVLIGLNHILTEFLDKTDKIDVIQTQKSEVVVKYDIDLGFALVINTNRKNSIIDKLMDNFVVAFKNRYRSELLNIQDLNRIIDTSDFLDTKDIIEEYFGLYL